MAYSLIRPEEEIDNLLNRCNEAEEEGASQFPGMTFEQGIAYALKWATDASAPHPLDEGEEE